jgi:hypothetical protein
MEQVIDFFIAVGWLAVGVVISIFEFAAENLIALLLAWIAFIVTAIANGVGELVRKVRLINDEMILRQISELSELINEIRQNSADIAFNTDADAVARWKQMKEEPYVDLSNEKDSER